MISGLYAVVVVLFFAGTGRLSTPRHERFDLHAWTWKDLWSNVRRGLTILGDHGPIYPIYRTTERLKD